MDIEREAWQVYVTLVAGGVAVVPTNAGYGLLAMGPQGVRRIYEMKGRPTTKPCVLVTTWRIFDEVAAPIASRRARVDRRHASVDAARSGHSAQSDVADASRASTRSCASRDARRHPRHVPRGRCAGHARRGDRVRGRPDWSSVRAETGRARAMPTRSRRSRRGSRPTRSSIAVRFRSPGAPELATTILDLPNGRFLREGLHFERDPRLVGCAVRRRN
jgi:hypothetical protein